MTLTTWKHDRLVISNEERIAMMKYYKICRLKNKTLPEFNDALLYAASVTNKAIQNACKAV